MALDAEAAGVYEVVPLDQEVTAVPEDQQHLAETTSGGVVFFGAGDNFRNMLPTVVRLSRYHKVHLVEWDTEPDFDVPRDQKYLVAHEDERKRLHDLLDNGGVDIGYIGLPPNKHEEVAEEHLQRIGKGAMRFLVLTKPIVPGIQELKRLRAAVDAAYARRRETRPDLEDPIIYIHEHVIEKGAWRALRERLPEVADKLGRLRSFVANYEEAQIIEDEDRGIDAFGNGALGDFVPHTASLALSAKDAINQSEWYAITDRSTTETHAFRYKDTKLREGVPTGFIVRGNASIIDKHDGSEHDMQFVWRAGKGLGSEDKKYVSLEFENPETGAISTIHVDLKNNILEFSDEVPDEVRDLFSGFYSTENGYGPVVEQGLNGGHPKNSFQPFEQGVVAAMWMFALERQAAREAFYIYDRNGSPTLEDMEEKVFGQKRTADATSTRQ